MTSEWNDFQLEDVADLNGGYAFKSEEYTETGHFVLRTVNITDDGRISTSGAVYVSSESATKYERFQLQELDTLFVMVGATLGKTGLVTVNDLPALLNQNMWVIRAKKGKVDPLYLHYAFKVLSKPLSSLASGSARGFVKRDDFRRMKIRLPKLKNQKNISSLLGALDDRITLLRETNQTLEAIAQALFKSWFVDFDPIRSNAEGRAPDGIDAATAALFPDAFDETEMGVVPKGWAFQAVGDLLVPKRGKSITKNKCVEGDIPVVAGGLEPAYFHNQSNVSSPVVTISASGANAGFVRLYQQDIWASDCSFVSAEQTETIYFWYVFLKFNQEKIYFMQQGAAQPHIYPSDLIRLHICSPQTDKLRGVFNSLVSPLFDRIGLNDTKIQTLSNIRDTLLPRLISGQLRIADAEVELEKATA